MRKFIILILGCLAFQLAICQNSFIYRFPGTAPTKTLIAYSERYDVTVLYEESDTGCYFHLYDNGNVRKVRCPSNTYVSDMTCIDQYVYYCGKFGVEGQGVIGRFNLGTLINGSSATTLTYDQGILNPTIYNQEVRSSKEVCKLECFEYNEKIYVAFISRFDSAMNNTAMGQAYFDGTDWIIDMDYNKGFYQNYYDLAITDNFIVAVGSNPNHVGYTVFAWKKGVNYLNAPINPHILHVNISGIQVKQTKITRMKNDEFVVAYHHAGTPSYISDDLFKVTPSGMIPLVRNRWVSNLHLEPIQLIAVAHTGNDSIVHLYNRWQTMYVSSLVFGLLSWVEKDARMDKVHSICKVNGTSYMYSGIISGSSLAFGYEFQPSVLPNCFEPTIRTVIESEFEATKDNHSYPMMPIIVKTTSIREFIEDNNKDVYCEEPYQF